MSRSFKFGGAIEDREQVVWVNRPEEQALLDEIFGKMPHPAYSLQAHRQMGKSTLLSRLAEEARARDWLVAAVDLREELFESSQNAAAFVDIIAKEFFRTTVGNSDYLEFKRELDADAIDQAKQRICGFVDRIVATGKNTLFLVDEFEAVVGRGGLVQVLFEATLHHAFQRRGQSVVWAYAGTHFATDLVDVEGADRSKYPVFRSWQLPDFDIESETVVDELVTGLTFEGPDPRSVCREVLNWTRGQPLLTSYLLGTYDSARANGKKPAIDEFCRSREFRKNEHFDYPLEILTRTPDESIRAVAAYRQLRRGRPVESVRELNQYADKDTTRLCLVGSGLVREDEFGSLEIRSPAYHYVFDEKWADYADAELFKQRLASSTIEPRRGGADASALPRIGIINAGGTLGMNFDGEKVIPPAGRNFWYLASGHFTFPAIIDDIHPGFPPTDGVKISPEEWTLLANRIVQAEEEDRLEEPAMRRRGIIILTGTDSLAYVASALAFALGRELPWPIVLTGSQAPFGIQHGDAEINLQRAISTVKDLNVLKEVVVAFGDEVYRGVRIEKANDFRYAGFTTPSYQPLAVLSERPRLNATAGQLVDVVTDLKAHEETLPKAHYEQYLRLLEEPVRTFDTDVLRVSLYPGLKETTLRTIVEGCAPSGLVLECLGLGNIPNDGDYNLLSIVQECRERQIPVLITGRFPVDPEFVGQYDAAEGPLRQGAISSGNITPAAALTKFMWGMVAARRALGDDPEFEELTTWLRGLFAISWVGEHDQARAA